jgi:hypothetical protein
MSALGHKRTFGKLKKKQGDDLRAAIDEIEQRLDDLESRLSSLEGDGTNNKEVPLIPLREGRSAA